MSKRIMADIFRSNPYVAYALICIALMSAALASCTDDLLNSDRWDYDESYEGEVKALPLSLSVKPLESSDPLTRSETVDAEYDENIITDIWLIEYNDQGTRVGLPRYFKLDDYYNTGDESEAYEGAYGGHLSGEISDLNFIVPSKADEEYTLVAIANTHDPSLFGPDNREKFSTLDSLRNFDIEVHNQEDFYDAHPEYGDGSHPYRFLLMSGYTKIDSEAEWLQIPLVRNACKIHLQVTDFATSTQAGEKFVFKYFQWVDVPLGKVFPHGSEVNYTPKYNRDWRMHNEEEKFNELCNGGIDFWLPTNVWLPEIDEDNDSDYIDKAEWPMAKGEDPIHFDIVVREDRGVDYGKIDGDSLVKMIPEDLYEFRIYPSLDAKTQFRLEPNHFYNIVADLNHFPGKEKENDFFKKVEATMLRESNCYMLTRDTKGIYAVPVSRINKYFGEVLNQTDYTIGEEEEWVAEVIWQDTRERIFDFALYEKGEINPERSKYFGIGDSWFILRTTGTGEGNVVVGVRRKYEGEKPIYGYEEDEPEIPSVDQREYLWSWHFWITDYNPYENPSATETVSVTNGKVFLQGDSFFMDRTLGSMASVCSDYENWNELYKIYGMNYQKGRKDPFPHPNPEIQGVYDINGNIIEAFNKKVTMTTKSSEELGRYSGVESEVLYDWTIKHPYSYMTLSTEGIAPEEFCSWLPNDPLNRGKRDWSVFSTEIKGKIDKINWNSKEEGKDIFDPCPMGWKMIEIELLLASGNGWSLKYDGTEAIGMSYQYGEDSVFLYPWNCRDGNDGSEAEGKAFTFIDGGAQLYYWEKNPRVFPGAEGQVNFIHPVSTADAGQIRCRRIDSKDQGN